ncbi:DUF1704 domain-containing protein [Candidatus Woesearchaeota archaeon]|jgi:uncharacterized protein (TIGR02421 family)|nr:DUF1704 domain-containing protein [Candidatus Woesearchaeota archaeon]
MDELKQIDNQLDKISKKLSFSILNPINVDKERKKFFSKENYNPQFKYKKPTTKIKSIKKALIQITPPKSVVGDILKKIRDKYLLDIELIENMGTDKFQNITNKLYGVPDKTLIKKANKLIYLKINPEEPIYSTNEIIDKLNIAFVKYGFNWNVEKKNMVASAAVKLQKKQLLIKTNSKFSENFLKRIIVHEIGTHIVRAENGENQPYKFFSRGLPGYLMTEEGLAVYNEEINDCLNNFILKIYAGRVIAINTAMNNSFVQTYSHLRKYFTKNTSWRLTLRAKRGLFDTEQNGALTKDIAYLKGYLQIKNYIKTNGNIDNLYYGKIGLEHIKLLNNIPNLIHPRFLPMFRYLKYFKGHFSDLINNILFKDSIKKFNLKNLKFY